MRHQRLVQQAIAAVVGLDDSTLQGIAQRMSVRYEPLRTKVNEQLGVGSSEIGFSSEALEQVQAGLLLVLQEVRQMRRMPVVNFAAGGVATPADAALMMLTGSDGVFVGSGIFKSQDPEARAKAIVEAVNHYDEPEVIAEVSRGIGEPMKGIEIEQLQGEQRLQERGW
jgi:pyridoxal 5'-phosphate synthase pdxS subunit